MRLAARTGLAQLEATWKPNHRLMLVLPFSCCVTTCSSAPSTWASSTIAAPSSSVYYDDQGKLAIAGHRIWRPTKTEQVKVSDIEDYIIELCQRFSIAGLWADPSQFLNSIQTLALKGILISEFTQTTDNLTRAGQNLFDLITGRNLRAYASTELREHALNSVAQETARGFRLVKSTAAKKIDAAIALAMASLRAIENGNPGLVGDGQVHGYGQRVFASPEVGSNWRDELF